MSKVNLFHYATSELSQDAFFAWLLSWASPDTEGQMHQYAQNFLRFLYKKANVEFPTIASLKVILQVNNIDIQCRINDNTVLLIEDKVNTKQHSEQLRRYRETLEQENFLQIIPFYIQTGDQSDYSSVINDGYNIITRHDLLQFFEENSALQSQIRNNILDDFVAYMREVEEGVQSYKHLPISKWEWKSWIGFYQELQKRLEDSGWDYVANPSGGFLGFWWEYLDNADGGKQYLQLEQDKLCIKISGESKEKCREVMYKYRDYFTSEAQKHGLPFTYPNRLRAGVWMTVAVHSEEYRVCNSDGIIDMDATVRYLERVTEFLNSARQP